MHLPVFLPKHRLFLEKALPGPTIPLGRKRLVPIKLDSFRFQGKEAHLEYFGVSFEDA